MESLGMFLESLSIPSETVGGSFAVIVFTAAIAVFSRVISNFVDFILRWQNGRRKRKEILIDIVIYAQTYNVYIKRVASEEALKTIRQTIKKNPGYRGYVAAINDSEVYEQYKEIRRNLRLQDMSKCDTYFDVARLFECYYIKLGSNGFAELS